MPGKNRILKGEAFMGLLKNLLGQKAEKHEQRGDTYLNKAVWGMAKIEYERALDRLEKGSPDYQELEERLQDKLIQSKEALATDHKETAENLMEQAHHDDARELFQLALELTADPGLVSAIQKRIQELEQRTAKDIQADAPSLPILDKRDSLEDEDEYFMALCGTLPEDVQREYASYGDAFRSGYLALNRGDFDRAVQYLSQAMNENPSPESFIPLELATAYLNLKQFDEARRLLETVYLNHPEALPVYELLCEIFWETGAFDQAESLLDDCPEELKNSMGYYLLRGETLFHAGRYPETVSFYRDLMKEYGWNETVAKALARTFETLGDLEEARQTYAGIMDQCRGCHSRIDPVVKRRYAEISFELGRYTSDVLEMYLSLAQEDPENSALYYQRVSRIYASLGNEEEARRYRLFAQQSRNGGG
jgi:tetratricopeptide (TPR) repeat protein